MGRAGNLVLVLELTKLKCLCRQSMPKPHQSLLILQGRVHMCTLGHLENSVIQEKKTTAAFGLGTNDRFFHDKKSVLSKPGMPGPGAYVLGASHGRQVSSIKQSYPINSFPKADRDRAAAAQYLGPKHLQTWGRGSPGPAIYSLKDSVGPQISSARPNAVHAGFGTADRFSYMNLQEQTPGPGSYSV